MRVTLCYALVALIFGLAMPHFANAQMAADFRGQGGVDLGFDGDTCDSSIGGAIRYNSSTNCAEICNGTDWTCPASSSSYVDSCPSVGDTCTDGSVFAGLSPDGQTKMYTTPADAPSLIAWNDGSPNWVNTAMVNCTGDAPGAQASCQTGEANTSLLVGLSGSGSPAPYQAAEYCDGLTAHGHSDWYLPAQDELHVLFGNKNAGDLNGTFDETGSVPDGYYWSSSERDNFSAKVENFDLGEQDLGAKDDVFAVRCVRKGE